MKLVQFYKIVDGDYNEVIKRLPKESSIIKFLRRFVDEPEYSKLIEAYEIKDYQEVFRTSHTLKGICANLGLTALQRSSSFVCEAVRNGDPINDIEPLVELLKFDYEKTVDAIGKLED